MVRLLLPCVGTVLHLKKGFPEGVIWDSRVCDGSLRGSEHQYWHVETLVSENGGVGCLGRHAGVGEERGAALFLQVPGKTLLGSPT